MTCRPCAPTCLHCDQPIDGKPAQSVGAGWSLCSACKAIGWLLVKVGQHWKLRDPNGDARERAQDIDYRRRMAS